MTADRTTLSAADFAAKWRDNARRERASSQEHFIDLCRLLGVPTPNEGDPSGESYTFEAGAERTSTGRQGWADIWRRGCFGWEYKGAHADLAAAYRQLLDYREDIENPPALVVSDMDLIEVHTNFTSTRPEVHRITLDDLAAGDERTAEALRVLRAVMLDPEELRPEQTPDEITEIAAPHRPLRPRERPRRDPGRPRGVRGANRGAARGHGRLPRAREDGADARAVRGARGGGGAAAGGVTGRLLQYVKQLPCGEELRTCTWQAAKDASFH